MMNFIEWCKQKGLALEASGSCTEPVRGATKVPGEKGDTNKYSGNVRKMHKDLSSDYKGNFKDNGTVEPFEVVHKGGGKPVASVAK